jgi:hypothetical protein
MLEGFAHAVRGSQMLSERQSGCTSSASIIFPTNLYRCAMEYKVGQFLQSCSVESPQGEPFGWSEAQEANKTSTMCSAVSHFGS